MPHRYAAFSGHGRSLINRRVFMATSGLGAAGLLLLSPRQAFASPIFAAVEKFANAVEAASVGADITAYIRRNEVSKQTALEVERFNCTARQQDFSDLSNSKVYALKAERNYFFYSIRHADHFNAIVNFFDRGQKPDAQFVGSISGPALFGIAEVAEAVARRHQAPTAKNALLPRQIIQASENSMERSNNRPDIYRTDAGVVRISYVTNGSGRGMVTIDARDDSGKLLAGGDYELTYHP